MANKRALKKTISLVCGELFAECVAISLYGMNNGCGEALIFSIVRLEDDFLRRVSHPEPGMPAKLYYKTLRNDFVEQAGEIIDHIHHHS